MERCAVIMDRDGTLCEEVGYISHLDRVRLLQGSAEAVRRANQAGFQTVVVSNQSGVARGYSSLALVEEVHDRIRQLLAEAGARLDGIYYCPHHPQAERIEFREECACRKPRPGMLLRAKEEMGIDLGASYVIGDSYRDVEAGHRVGSTTILVLTGYGKEELAHGSSHWPIQPHHIALDLLEAVDWLLAREATG